MLERGFDQFVREFYLDKNAIIESGYASKYPFSLKAVKALESLELHPNVTFLVGENGSGKSTLLEALAVSYGFNPEGGTKNFNFSTEASHSELHKYIRLVKGIRRAKDGFFLRAESFYNVASSIDQMDREPYGGAPIIASYGGVSLHKQSHGEAFMTLMQERFSGNGVYILDEPEAALSPTRQMAMLTRIHDLVQKDAQFIIATHSPIIMSYPNAIIYNVDDDFKEISYKDTEHHVVMRKFMNRPEEMLSLLLENE